MSCWRDPQFKGVKIIWICQIRGQGFPNLTDGMQFLLSKCATQFSNKKGLKTSIVVIDTQRVKAAATKG